VRIVLASAQGLPGNAICEEEAMITVV